MADAQFGAKTQNNGFKNDGNITDNLIGDLAKQVAKQSEKIKSLKDENANLRDRTTRAETQLQAIATAQTARCHAVSSQQQYVGNLDRSYSLKSDASDQKVAAVSNRVIAVEDSVEAHEKKLTSSLERLGDAHHGTEEELKKVIGDVKFNSRCIDDEIIKTDSLTIEHKGVADKLAKFEKERHEFGLQQLACNESMMAGNTKLGKTFTDGLKKVKEDHEKDIAQVKEDMNTLKSELTGDVHTLKCSTATGIQKMNDTMVEDAKSHVSLRRKVDNDRIQRRRIDSQARSRHHYPQGQDRPQRRNGRNLRNSFVQ